jgi:HK97 gp10 family phage protein
MSGNVKLDWDGDHCRSVIVAEVKRRIYRCLILVYNHAKILINVDGTGKKFTESATTKTGKPRKNRKFKLAYGANPSKPGDPPHKQTGRLLASVAFEIQGLIGRVGTNLKYGRWLELGTRKMKARPWLRRAFNECQAQIQAILRQPMKGP